MTVLRPLILLGVILTASGLAAEQLGPIVGPVEYNGYLVFDYPEGDNPITNIVFDVDPWVSESLLIVNVPAPWTYTYSDPVLTIGGGSLNPGGSVSVTVSLDDYFEEGEYQVTSVGTTSAGEVSNAIGPLLVGDLYLLQVISLANTYQTPLLGSVIGLIALELMFWQRNRPLRDIIPPVKEVNDFIRESEKILNKDGTPEVSVPEDKPYPDFEHKSVIDEISGHDINTPYKPEIDLLDPLTRSLSAHVIDSMRKHRENAHTSDEMDKAIADELIPEWNKAKSSDDIAKVLGDSLGSKSKYSAVDPPDPSEISTNQPKVDTPDIDDVSGLDESDLPGLDDIPDSSEYDNSDLPGLEKPETDSFSPEYDSNDLPGLNENDLPGLDDTTDARAPKKVDGNNLEQKDTPTKKKKFPTMDPDEVIDG